VNVKYWDYQYLAWRRSAVQGLNRGLRGGNDMPLLSYFSPLSLTIIELTFALNLPANGGAKIAVAHIGDMAHLVD
jgi:hypothetical protein